MAAGRIMMRRLKELAAARASFAFETTLASRTFATWLADLKAGGSRMHLVFLWLPSAEVAIARVAERVRRGGHDVPETTIRRRYHAGWANFCELYQPLADSWQVIDNSVVGKPRVIAAGQGRRTKVVRHKALWDRIRPQP
jgi:predicted ABC-type ATPase